MLSNEILIKPQTYIKFVCGLGQPFASIEITTSIQQRYNFLFRTNNPSKYLVSQNRGIISQSPYYIKISLKHNKNLHKRLTDRFELQIKDDNNGVVLIKQLKVLLQYNGGQQHLQELQQHDDKGYGDECFINSSTIPSLGNTYMDSSNLKKTNRTVRRKFVQGNKISQQYPTNQNTFKQKFNETVIALHQNNRKMEQLMDNRRKNSAKFRLQLYLFFIISIIALLFGIFLRHQCNKRINNCKNLQL